MNEKERAEKIFEEVKRLGLDVQDAYGEFKRRLSRERISFAEYVLIEKELEPVRGKINLKKFKGKFDDCRSEPEGGYTFAFVSKSFKFATVRRIVV